MFFLSDNLENNKNKNITNQNIKCVAKAIVTYKVIALKLVILKKSECFNLETTSKIKISSLGKLG